MSKYLTIAVWLGAGLVAGVAIKAVTAKKA
jgi:hypothetical protein